MFLKQFLPDKEAHFLTDDREGIHDQIVCADEPKFKRRLPLLSAIIRKEGWMPGLGSPPFSFLFGGVFFGT